MRHRGRFQVLNSNQKLATVYPPRSDAEPDSPSRITFPTQHSLTPDNPEGQRTQQKTIRQARDLNRTLKLPRRCRQVFAPRNAVANLHYRSIPRILPGANASHVAGIFTGNDKARSALHFRRVPLGRTEVLWPAIQIRYAVAVQCSPRPCAASASHCPTLMLSLTMLMRSLACDLRLCRRFRWLLITQL